MGERIRMLTGLGMTETAPFAVCANGPEVKSGYIGLPAPGMELKLVPEGDFAASTSDSPERRSSSKPTATPGTPRSPRSCPLFAKTSVPIREIVTACFQRFPTIPCTATF